MCAGLKRFLDGIFRQQFAANVLICKLEIPPDLEGQNVSTWPLSATHSRPLL
jgi:hypothetical protein